MFGFHGMRILLIGWQDHGGLLNGKTIRYLGMPFGDGVSP
jgi:hypothetical protein